MLVILGYADFINFNKFYQKKLETTDQSKKLVFNWLIIHFRLNNCSQLTFITFNWSCQFEFGLKSF